MADNINALATFVDSEQFLNALTSGTAPNGIYIVNNVDINNLKSRVQNELNLATIATSGAFSDLTSPPTKAELLEILQLSEQGTAYTNHVDWDNVDNKPSDLGGGGQLITNVSQLTNDVGYITGYNETDPLFTEWVSTFSEADPIFSNSAAANITSSDIENWNSKTSFDGSYNSLTNRPNMASVAISGDYRDLSHKPIKTYDISSSSSNNIKNLTTSITDNISTTLLSSGSDSIQDFFTDLITDYNTNNSLIKLVTNIGNFYVIDIQTIMTTINSQEVFAQVISLTSHFSNNYDTIANLSNQEILAQLTTTIENCIIIVDLANDKLIIKKW